MAGICPSEDSGQWQKTWELVRIRGGALFRSIHVLFVDPAT
jgi:hypothetical protein